MSPGSVATDSAASIRATIVSSGRNVTRRASARSCSIVSGCTQGIRHGSHAAEAPGIRPDTILTRVTMLGERLPERRSVLDRCR